MISSLENNELSKMSKIQLDGTTRDQKRNPSQV